MSLDDLPASLLWCYDERGDWFFVALYLCLTSSSFVEVFLFLFCIRITFREIPAVSLKVRRNESHRIEGLFGRRRDVPVERYPDSGVGAVERYPDSGIVESYPRRRLSNVVRTEICDYYVQEQISA